MKLQEVYQSKGPARKATLLKQLTLTRIEKCGDVRTHISTFFDIVDKLKDMDVEINNDLLAILLLYSLPPEYENFRCAIESRDTLPEPEILRIKIIEESDASRNEVRAQHAQHTQYVEHPAQNTTRETNNAGPKCFVHKQTRQPITCRI